MMLHKRNINGFDIPGQSADNVDVFWAKHEWTDPVFVLLFFVLSDYILISFNSNLFV